MEPARDRSREDAQRELDEILREADASRRALEREAERPAGDRPAFERAARLRPVGAASASAGGGASRVRILYETETTPPPRTVEPGRARARWSDVPPAVVAAVWALAALLWLRFPSGLPALQARPLSPGYQIASARYALWLTQRRIDRFTSDHRRPPAALDELEGGAPERIAFDRGAAGGRLTAVGPDGPIRLVASEARRAPTAGTRSVLLQGPGR
jgi:hypothetical protein